MPSAALTDDEVRLVRLSAQRLLQSAPVRPRDVVRAVVGVQAQDQTAAALQLRARSAGLTLAEVARARNEERTVVRTWAIRGTLHWLAVEDVRWLLELLGEDAIRRNRRRREQLGLDDQTCIEAVRLLREDLAARGPLTRDEIVSELADRGVRLEGQARPHLLYVAAFQGVICGGPDRGSQETYVLIDDWVPRSKALPREKTLAELARRYLAAFGPATVADFAAWSGLVRSDAHQGWRAITRDTTQIDTSRGPMSLLGKYGSQADRARVSAHWVRLLGAFDTYLLGYADRELVVPAKYTKRVNAGGGIVRPTLLIDGRVGGTWKSLRQRSQLEIVVDPFEPLDREARAGIESEAADIERFLGLKATVNIGSS